MQQPWWQQRWLVACFGLLIVAGLVWMLAERARSQPTASNNAIRNAEPTREVAPLQNQREAATGIEVSTSPAATPTPLLVGTHSCSARGCHGRIEAGHAPTSGQNEYLQWLRDPHAGAFRTLLEPRSADIVRRLGGKTPAHEDVRCLACHTNPALAVNAAELPTHQRETLFGVGCESCHGNAARWLGPHSRPEWATLANEVKQQVYAMTSVNDLATRARVCAGCHVGAPPDATRGLPVRDINHDMIAAGHPRLTFELSAYQANMPAHWRRSPTQEAHLWHVGQLVAAETALELLAYRASSANMPHATKDPSLPWPEFAEYDCFACHHSLTHANWRQALQHTRRGRPGTLPWGTWYMGLVRLLPLNSKALIAIDALEEAMQQTIPDRRRVAELARSAAREFANLRRDLDAGKSAAHLQQLLARIETESQTPIRSWDEAEQAFLALHAANQAEPRADRVEVIEALTEMRAFPPGLASPRSPTKTDADMFDPREFLRIFTQRK